MKVKIEAETGAMIRFWIIPVAIFLLGIAVYSARKALIIILVAFFLAIALNKPVTWLSKHLPKRSRVGGTAVAFALVVVVLGGLVVLLVPPVVEQTAKVAQQVPALVDSATAQYNGLSEVIDRYGIQEDVDRALDNVKQTAAKWATDVPLKVIHSLSSLGAVVAGTVISLVMAFFMLVEGPRVMRQFWRLYVNSDKQRQHAKIAKRLYGVVSGFVVGQLAIAGIGATAMGLFVLVLSWIFPIPANLVFPTAAIYGISTLIPYFGSIIAAIILTLLLLLNSFPAALVFLVGYLIWQQIEANFISTIVQSRQLNLTALWVFVAATVGLYMFGILGAIISIPIAGVIRVLVEEYVNERESALPKRRSKLARTAAKKSKTA